MKKSIFVLPRLTFRFEEVTLSTKTLLGLSMTDMFIPLFVPSQRSLFVFSWPSSGNLHAFLGHQKVLVKKFDPLAKLRSFTPCPEHAFGALEPRVHKKQQAIPRKP